VGKRGRGFLRTKENVGGAESSGTRTKRILHKRVEKMEVV